jgi:phosphatidylserine/phosphatidylglycerophosphate/cardiolipin synthase-like enzyme
MGTFHAKYMVVDRRIAILNSNNIQDRVNLEQMTHIEGPIVQSFYDVALLSWAEPMEPPMPLLANPNLVHAFGQDPFEHAALRKRERHLHLSSWLSFLIYTFFRGNVRACR